MHAIRELTEADLEDFMTISVNAYPGLKVANEKEWNRFRQRLHMMNQDPTIHFYGLFENGRLLGGMRLHDFRMKLLSVKTLVGGIGGLAVDLLHKKEKVARDMVLFFLQHYRDKGACMAALYPFRPDFYKKMGFGYGTKLSQYCVRPADLPRGPSKDHVRFLGEGDKEKLRRCYQRYLESTNGLMEKSDYALNAIFREPTFRVVGYERKGQILGYIVFKFQSGNPGNFLNNDLVVREFVYETSEALRQLLTFLHTQADQIDRILFNVQDDTFHHLLLDPRNGTGHLLPSVYHESNVQGVGIMYRVIDTPGLFRILEKHNFGQQNCRLKVSLTDTLCPQNAGSTVIHFMDGVPRPEVGDEVDVEIWLDVSEFSSMVMGVITFKKLLSYGLAQISDAVYVDVVDRLFRVEQKPLCMTNF